MKIAESGVLDILSIGPDQNAQEHFFHPENMDHSQDGARCSFTYSKTGNL